MKTFQTLLALLCLLFAIPSVVHAGAAAGEDATVNDFTALTYTGTGGSMPYRLFTPDGFQVGVTTAKYPLVIFLHGLGEKGSDNYSQLNLTSPLIFLTAKNRLRNPCFMVAPQTPSDWAGRQVSLSGIITSIMTQYSANIDTDRIYLTGISLGGNGTWVQASQNPTRYAAVVPVAGWGPYAGLTNVPMWTFHAQNDPTVPISGFSGDGDDPNVAALRAAGGQPIFTRYNTGGHQIWDTAYNTPGLVEWVMAQRKGQKPVAGPQILSQLMARGSTLTVTGTLAQGVEPTGAPVSKVTWKNLTNSGTGLATGTSVWSATGIPLVSGTNLVQVVASAGVWSTWGGTTTYAETLNFFHIPPAGGTPAVLAITAPTAEPTWTTSSTTITLSGTVGSTVTLSWTNDRGTSGGGVAASGTWSFNSIPLQPGANVLGVTASDAAGNITRGTLRVWQGAERPPLVTTGLYQIIPSGTSASLSASVWRDQLPPGATVSLAWSKVNGPGTVTFSATTSAATSATFSQPGTYTLAVTGSSGTLSDVAQTLVVVRPASGTATVAINCGGTTSYVAADGTTYAADNSYTNGDAGTTYNPVTDPVPGTSDAQLYRRFRKADSWQPSFTYAVPVANGTYNLTLKFLDPSGTYLSQRRFDLLVEGAVVANNVDIAKLVGNSAAMDLVFPVTVSDGTLNIAFNRDIGGAILSAILLQVQSGPPANQAPVVNAGPDQTITLPATASLAGSVTDDGLAPGNPTPTATWSKFSGTGAVSFANANSATTTATFSATGVYVLRLTGSDGALSATDDVTITVNASGSSGGGAAGWLNADIGSVASAGSGTVAPNGTITIVGSGSNYGGAQDQMHFTYLQANGDCSIVARVASLSGPSAYDTRVGVMVRESLGNMGRYAAMTLSNGAGTFSSYRTGPAEAWSSGQWGPNSEVAPYWVKVTRVGQVFTTYKSPDGVTWTQVQSTTLAMGSTSYIGLMVCAGSTTTTATATFDNVTTTGTGPLLLNADIGSVASVGSGTVAPNGTVTIVGSGSNYGGAQDQMHFTYVQATDDCSIVARVATLSGPSAYDTRVGVTVRESLGNMGRYAAMTLSNGAGTFSSYRTGPAEAWSSGQWGPNSEVAPYWVKLTRVGQVFTTYKSPDGVTWTQVQSTTLAMGSTAYVGLMVCAGSTTTTATATFDNLTIVP